MPRLALLLLMALFVALPAQAQDDDNALPVYRIYVNTPPAIEGSNVVVAFGVTNTGGPASVEATAILTEATSGVRLDIKPIPPLDSGGIEIITFQFPVTELEAGLHSLQASVSTDIGGAITEGTTARTSITIPEGDSQAADTTPEATAAPSPDERDEAGGEQGEVTTPGFMIPGTDVRVDLTQPLHIGVLIAVAGIALVLLWVLTVILRLLFASPPKLNTWQPPYAYMSMLDPNSAAGRRQLWQPHAQNDAITSPCAEGNYHIRKLLLGMDGTALSSWRVTAIRMSQYDMYGRVARSQTLAASKLVRRLDSAARRGQQTDEARALKMVLPVARSLVRQFDRGLNKRNATLPVALDIRLRGAHGDVRILFELYGCFGGNWQLVDQWEPEMVVLRGAIHENFTYTVYGKRPNEQHKAYRERVVNEIARILAEMVTRRRAEAPPPPTSTTPQLPQRVPQEDMAVPGDTVQHPAVNDEGILPFDTQR